MQVYYGSVDDVIVLVNYNYFIVQWMIVFGYFGMFLEEKKDVFERRYIMQVFGEKLMGIWVEGVGYGVLVYGEEDMKFFGL